MPRVRHHGNHTTENPNIYFFFDANTPRGVVPLLMGGLRVPKTFQELNLFSADWPDPSSRVQLCKSYQLLLLLLPHEEKSKRAMHRT